MDKIKELEHRIAELELEVGRLQAVKLNREEVMYHIKSQIEDWAENGNTDPIPENKLPDVIDRGQIIAIVKDHIAMGGKL